MSAVSSIVEEVLDGFSCTIFAYGQTGTGKTYTMTGDLSTEQAQLSVSAGVIPRAIHQIFNYLEVGGWVCIVRQVVLHQWLLLLCHWISSSRFAPCEWPHACHRYTVGPGQRVHRQVQLPGAVQ